jgi:hypothetical protein
MSGATAAMLMAAAAPTFDLLGSSGGTLSGTHIGAYSVGIQFTTAGDINKVDTVGSTDIGDWISPKGLASGNYTVAAHQVSGTAVGGSALDTDLALSSNREWDLLRSSPGTNNAQITLTLKYLGTTVKTATLNLQATAT